MTQSSLPPLADTLTAIRAFAGPFKPRVAIVLGSGLGKLADQVTDAVAIPYAEIPGFPVSAVSGHAGKLILGQLGGLPVMLFAGRSHFYEAGVADVMYRPLQAAKALGAEVLLLSNAAGSTRVENGPGTLMLITDHVSWSGRNPLIGKVHETGFVDLTRAYDRDLQALMRSAAESQDIALAEGVYGWFSGPTYETPAEIRICAQLGIDAVGMSTVPETILARALGLRVAGVSLMTNLAAGLSEGLLDHAEVKEEGEKAAARFEALVLGFLKGLSAA